MYVYIKSETDLWTAGFYAPDGEWMPESDHNTQEEAGDRVRYLNGGEKIFQRNGRLESPDFTRIERASLMLAAGILSNSPDWSETVRSVSWVAMNSVKYAKAVLEEANK